MKFSLVNLGSYINLRLCRFPGNLFGKCMSKILKTVTLLIIYFNYMYPTNFNELKSILIQYIKFTINHLM